MIALIVTVPFADYAKGDQISDPEAVAAIAESHAAHVVRINVGDDAPAAAKPAKPAKAAKTT